MEVLHDETVLAETEFVWEFGQTMELSLKVLGDQLTGSINGQHFVTANSNTFSDGAIGLLIEEGRSATNTISVKPVS